MVLGSGQEQVVAYRPSHAFPALAKRSVVPSPAREVPFARRHRLARGLVDRSASTALGSISQRFAVQDFCRSVTSSEASPVGPHHNNDPLADGIIVPKRRRRPEPVAGIARLINVWNPKMTLKPSNFKESAASKPCVAADAHGSHAHHPRASVDSLSPPCHDSAPHYMGKHRRLPSRACFSCGERETPQWRCGPSGTNTLCNVCGLIYAKRQRKVDRHHNRNWRRALKLRRHS